MDATAGRAGRPRVFLGWTPEAIRELRDLWADEALSASEIGRRLGTSKNAVISKANRLRLPSRPSPIVRGYPSRPRGPRKSGAVTLAPLPAAAPRPVVVPVERVAPEPVVVRPRRLARGTCCWPEGEPRSAGFRFCGAPRELRADGTERPYCAAHAGRAYLRPGQVVE